MSYKAKTLITGATGQIGSAVLRRVAADPTLEVIAAVRSPEKASGLGLPTVHLDYDRPETLLPALQGIDRVFMATGYTIRMFRQSRDFLNAARRADVELTVHLGAPGNDDTPVEPEYGAARRRRRGGDCSGCVRPRKRNLRGHRNTVASAAIRQWPAKRKHDDVRTASS